MAAKELGTGGDIGLQTITSNGMQGGGPVSPWSPFGVGSHLDGEPTVGFAAVVCTSPVQGLHRGLILPWPAPALLAGPRRWQQTVPGCPAQSPSLYFLP